MGRSAGRTRAARVTAWTISHTHSVPLTLVRMDAVRLRLSFACDADVRRGCGRGRCGALRAHAPQVLGLPFRNRVGLAAGFDKEGHGIRALSRLGFGHIEVGTVTGHAQPGNERPRLFRLLEHEAILNRMGFNNAGSKAASFAVDDQRRAVDRLPESLRPIIGVNIGKTKVVEAADAAADYALSTRTLAPYADYLVINVSSPNTPGLRDLQAVDSLRPIIAAVRDTAAEVVETPRSRWGMCPCS